MLQARVGRAQPVRFRAATERPQAESRLVSYSALAEDENEHDDEDNF